jgi:putative flippase GtrA
MLSHQQLPRGDKMSFLIIMVLAFVQNVVFSMASRARNRDHMTYNAVSLALGSIVWYVTMHYLVMADLTFYLLIPYVIGTVVGSVCGAKISMRIELLIGAKA